MTTEVSRIFNSAITAAAISSGFETGLFDELKRCGRLNIASFCGRNDLHVDTIAAMMRALACFDLISLEQNGKVASTGRHFDQAYDEKGYFLWLVRGYGELLQRFGDFARNSNRPADPEDRHFLPRDGHSVAAAGRDYGARYVDHHVNSLLAASPPSVLLDLGCGSAGRIIELAEKYPALTAIGVDVDEGAVRLATRNVARHGLQDRISIHQADIRELPELRGLHEVDTCMCFFMGHDLWPREHCRQIMLRLRTVLPNLDRFLLGDTYRSDLPTSAEPPIFTLGFEVTHAVMGQYIPSREEWLSLFEDSDWDCRDQHDLDIPYSTIFELTPAPRGESLAHAVGRPEALLVGQRADKDQP